MLLLDDDAFPAEGCLEALLAAADSDPRAALVTPRVVRAEDPELIHYDGGRAHFLGETCLENAWTRAADAAPPSSRPTAVASTALLVHRERALACGLFDEELLFFREDLEFSLRLRAHGWTIAHAPAAVVRHGRPDGSRGPLHRRRTFLQTRNRWWVMLKLWEARTLAATLPLQAGYELLQLALALSRGEAGQWAAAHADLARRLPAILRARRAFQAARVVPDRELLGAPPLGWTPRVRALPLAGALKPALDALCAAWWGR